MKRRVFLLFAPALLAVALLAPVSTSAATTGYTFKVVNQHCEPGGYGHNPYFDVSLTAAGSTPANKLTIKSVSQYYSAGKWHTYFHWATDKKTFKPNGQAHTIDYWYDHNYPNDTRKWRIVSTLKAYNGSTVLAKKTLKSKAC